MLGILRWLGLVALLKLQFAASSPSVAAVEYPPRSLEPQADPRKWGAADVQDWVESVGFSEYRDVFRDASVNGKRLLGMTVEKLESALLLPLEHAQLFAMEIGELRARRSLMSTGELNEHLAAHPLADQWDYSAVRSFLQESGFGPYAASFAVDGPALLRMRDDELLARMRDGRTSVHEETEAAAEQLSALTAHLRWRSANFPRKDEL
jgi:hypothetical protein